MNESPFTKEEVQFHREQTSYEKVKDTLIETVNDNFIDWIPSDDIKQLPPIYLYPTGILLFSILMAVFLAVFITGYKSGISQTYLSPISPPGYDPDKYCDAIPIYNSGTYLATETGIWEGASGFQYAQAAYSLTVTSFSVGYDEYKSLMHSIYVNLAYIGEQAMSQDLAQNLVYWMSLKYIPPSGNTAQSFYMGGTPLTIFDRQKTTGIVSNWFADCNATSTTDFDPSTGLFTLQYVYEEFVNNPTCVSAMYPPLFNYVSGANGNYLTLQIDVRTLITGIAINNNILGLYELTEIPAFGTSLVYLNVTYQIGSYFDAKYPGMEPLICLVSSDVDAVLPASCVVRVSAFTYGFPLFNHLGNNTDYPLRCNCSERGDLASPYHLCNQFNFLTGFLFYNTSTPYAMFEIFDKANTTEAINREAYNATYVASYFGQKSPYKEEFNTREYRDAVYDFCRTETYGNCSIVTFTSFDVAQYNWAINGYYYQLQNGACENTLILSEADWNKLGDTPFSSLTEQYEKCHNDPTTVFLNQAGVSVGNVSIVTPAAIAFVLGVLYIYSQLFKVKIPKSYSKNDKDRALNTLAISLLLARDNKLTKNSKRSELESLLMKIVEELSENADVTSNHYATKVEEAGGLNWSYISDKAKAAILNPLRSSESTTQRTDRQVSNVGLANSSNRHSGATTNGGIELGDVTQSHPLEEPRQLTACEKALQANPKLTILNKPSVTQEKQPESKHKTTISSAILSVEEFISKFERIIEEKNESSPEYWILSSKTAALGKLNLLIEEGATDVELRQFYSRLKDLVIFHASLTMKCAATSVYDSFNNSVSYYVNGEVLLLKEIQQRATHGEHFDV